MSVGYQIQEVEEPVLVAHKEDRAKGAHTLQKIDAKRKKIRSLFLPLFKKNEWDLDESKLNLFVFSRKSLPGKIKIELSDDASTVTFSGTPVEKIIEAAKVYKKSEKNVTFEVEADDLEDAKKFMRLLQEKGFDISQITKMTLKDKNKVNNDDLEDMIQDIQARVNPPKKTAIAKPKAKPGSSTLSKDK